MSVGRMFLFAGLLIVVGIMLWVTQWGNFPIWFVVFLIIGGVVVGLMATIRLRR